MKVLISAGEESGDLYAADLAAALEKRLGPVDFFGCAGPKLRAAGIRPVVEAEQLAVVGLVEVLGHLPRIYREFRRLVRAARAERPDVAILVDSPDFHLRLAAQLARLGVPVVYLIAPQAWAWRGWRVHKMGRVITRLLCIFPFEEKFFNTRGVPATYIGHPLAETVKPALGRDDFFRKHRLPAERPLVAVLPGSRRGEAARHLPLLLDSARELNAWRAITFVVAASRSAGKDFFANRLAGSGIRVIEGETYDVLAHADLALVASGTATVEAALLGAPMVTFYRVHPATWILGKWFVDVPFFSMVNLLAGERVVPELIQADCTPARLTAEARELLDNPAKMGRMRLSLARLRVMLASGHGAMERAAGVVEEVLAAAGQAGNAIERHTPKEVRSR